MNTDEVRNVVIDGFARAARLCTDKFLMDPNHRGKRNPFVDGPCDTCSNEIAVSVREELDKQRSG